jgi:hypothetical protein
MRIARNDYEATREAAAPKAIVHIHDALTGAALVCRGDGALGEYVVPGCPMQTP